MDYREFTDRQTAFEKFIKYRKDVFDAADKGKFDEVFEDLCARAMQGDCVAQDCVAYFFNKGVPDFLVPNYEYYMSWQILAGANGNMFALEKLEFFLQAAVNDIIYDDEILPKAIMRRNVSKDNALMVISNLLCEGIADELRLDPKDLIQIGTKPSAYSPEKNRVFVNALRDCLPNVVEYLLS